MILKYIINNNINVKFYKSFKEMFNDLKQSCLISSENSMRNIILLENNGNNNSFSNVNELIEYCKQILKERKKESKK